MRRNAKGITTIQPLSAAILQRKIIVGAGGTAEPGWESFDQSALDITQPSQWLRVGAPFSVDAILAEHVWEHLTVEGSLVATRNCSFYLKHGGYLRLAVPDGLHPNPTYIEWVSPGRGWNGDDHKQLFDYRSLSALLVDAGFQVQLLEYWDEYGGFHSYLYNQTDGIIRRTAWGDQSALLSAAVGCRYTSLVIEGVKPIQ